MSLFLCLSSSSLGQYCEKVLSKAEGFSKKDKKGGLLYRWLYVEMEVQTLSTICCYNNLSSFYIQLISLIDH